MKSRIHLDGTDNSTKKAQHCPDFNSISTFHKKLLYKAEKQGLSVTTVGIPQSLEN